VGAVSEQVTGDGLNHKNQRHRQSMLSWISKLLGTSKPRRRQKPKVERELTRRNPPAKLPPPRDDLPGRQGNMGFAEGDLLGANFHVYGVLGVGGFGIVLAVYEFSTQEICAVKTFRDELLADAETRESFKQEASRWVDIGEHPFILTARSVHEISNRLFVKMDYVGPDQQGRMCLAHYLSGAIREQIELEQQLKWSIEFCLGMEHANERGIRCHRDIKPQNILITADKSLKITDFGLALVAQTSSVKDTVMTADAATPKEQKFSLSILNANGKRICGTPGYIPPEIYRGEQGDVRSDIYSFGLVLWQLASQSPVPPFSNYLKGSLDAYLRMVYETQIAGQAPPVEGPLQPLIVKCLAVEPMERYQTFASLRDDLETVLWRIFGKSVEVPHKTEVQSTSLYQRAISFSSLGRHSEALAAVEEASRIAPQEIMPRVFRLQCLFKLGRGEEALQQCDELLQANPDHNAPIFAKAALLSMSRRPQEALPWFEKVLARMPNHFQAWQGKLDGLIALGNFTEALACCERVLELQPKDPNSWADKADVLVRLNRFPEAIDCCDQSLALDPRFANAWLNKGIALSRLQRLPDANRCFDTALGIDETLALAWAEKGRNLRLLNRDSDAQECHNKAIALDPSYRAF
jgi:serine/threonine protein kinase